MKYRLDAMVQRPFNHAIVDEVDSILIDEARTPLIISGPAEDSSELYRRADTVIPKLKAEHFEKDEKNRTVVLTDAGIEAIEEILRTDGLLAEGISLYAPNMVSVLHHITQALRAHKLFSRDVDYIVKDGQVVIIDEFTGRMMSGPPLLRGPAPGARGQGDMSRSSARTRRWLRSPSRTCSACIRSSRA